MLLVKMVTHKEPDELVESLFESCDALMVALDVARQNNDTQRYAENVDLLIRAAALSDNATV